MKITALDIRQKTFEKAFRGLNKEEVEAFLVTLSQQWERMGDENRELRVKLDHATQDVSKMREVESSLYRTLKTAEDTGNSITEQAQRDAELRIREAQLKAEQLLADARQKARAVVEDAYQQSEKTIAEMKKEVSGLGQECQRLEAHLEGLVRDLHHLASEALAKAEKARAQPKASTAAILSRAASVKVNRPDSEPDSPQPAAPMYATSSASSSAAAIGSSATSFSGSSSAAAVAEPRNYNPKPGQQPDPGAPAQTPGPDIRPNPSPDENPGKADPSRIYEPGPAVVPNPVEPYTEPVAPDIQPISPGHPEIAQPAPATHPGQPGMAAVASTEKSFFDEI